MTYDEKCKIDDMRKNGCGCTTIANTLGLSLNSVKSYCRRTKPQTAKPVTIEIKEGGCEYCGAELVHIEGKKKKRFCSDKCRISWWNHHRDKLQHRNPISIKCKCCRKVFISSNSSRKYCSMNCYNKTRCNT